MVKFGEHIGIQKESNYFIGIVNISRENLILFEPAQIVHESETQRQFIRLQLPAHVEINGARYDVKDLSTAGLALRNIDKDFKKGQSHAINLFLPFADFTLDIDLKIEVQYIDKKLEVAGCRFIDLSQNKISILSHVIRAFMTGDIIKGDKILSVVARDNFVNVRKHNEDYTATAFEQFKKYSIYAFIGLAIISLSSFIIGNVLNNLFVIKSAEAQVYAPTIEIISPASGTYINTLADNAKTVTKGQLIARINDIKIQSPCNCTITQRFILLEQYIAQDTKILNLISRDTPTLIKARVSIEDVHNLEMNGNALIQISGQKEKIKGKIQNILIEDESIILTTPKASVYIKTEQALPIELLNTPAFVEFYL